MNCPCPRRCHTGWWWLVLPLAGCLSPPLEPPAPPVPQVATVAERHLVAFAGSAEAPDTASLTDLDHALDRLGDARRLDLRVTAPNDGGRTTLARRRISAVAAHLRVRHLDARVTALLTDGVSPADVTVDVRGLQVVTPSCPDWSRDLAGDPANRAMSNLGCATARNLGLMLDDPGDLEQGSALGSADGAREAEAVVRYRTDKVKPLQDELSQP